MDSADAAPRALVRAAAAKREVPAALLEEVALAGLQAGLEADALEVLAGGPFALRTALRIAAKLLTTSQTSERESIG